MSHIFKYRSIFYNIYNNIQIGVEEKTIASKEIKIIDTKTMSNTFIDETKISDDITNNDIQFQRQPHNVLPTHYSITILPDFNSFIFHGIVNIYLNIKQTDSNKIILNTSELTVYTCTLSDINNTKLCEQKHETDREKETTTFYLPSELQLEIDKEIILNIPYSGSINDKMLGFYRSKYIDKSTNPSTIKWFGVTQFEAIDARKAFPCWDEPNFKSTFDVSLIVSEKYQVFFNEEEDQSKKRSISFDISSNLIDSSDDNIYEIELAKKFFTMYNKDVDKNKVISHIKQYGIHMDETTNEAKTNKYIIHSSKITQIISTYLVAFVVGIFSNITKDYVSKQNGKTIPVSIVTTPDKISKANYALDVAYKSIEFFENFFKIPYPFSKCTNIAIADFSSGAMENAGCIIYREVCILIDENESSMLTKYQVAITISHEISHQWYVSSSNYIYLFIYIYIYIYTGSGTW